MHTCIHAYMHTCIHAYIHTYIRTYTYTHMHTHIHTFKNIRIHKYTHIHIHAYAALPRPGVHESQTSHAHRGRGLGYPLGGAPAWGSRSPNIPCQKTGVFGVGYSTLPRTSRAHGGHGMFGVGCSTPLLKDFGHRQHKNLNWWGIVPYPEHPAPTVGMGYLG